MRLEAQRRGGYYPVAPDAIKFLAERVRPPDPPAPFTMLDPCAGRGEAIKQWSETLGCDPERVYAIELEEDRSAAIRGLLPSAKVLGPCSTFGCRVAGNSFPFIWCNPPFDDAMGGGARVELQFLDRATRWIAPGGVMCFLCPEHVMKRKDMQDYIKVRYETVTVVKLPESVRPFGEVATFAVRRNRFVDPAKVNWIDVLCRTDQTYTIPPSSPPHEFEQTAFTPRQLREAVDKSPLLKMLREPPERTIPRPPLELGHGHIALLLASGLINGIVCPENEPPHVVRGVSRKEEYLKEIDVKEDGSGHTEIYAERMEIIVRTVDVTGTIKTFGSAKKQESTVAG